MQFRSNDERWMRYALSLGRRGLGMTWPNPSVGCLLVRNGRPVGRGWTQPGGRPHAEAMAISKAGERAEGATAYITLEPCLHFGQTRPCARALIDSGVGRVVASLRDPDPRVSGNGFAIIRQAGVRVETGCLAREACIDHLGFLLRTTRARPMITLRLAKSFDGKIATSSGDSRWITSSRSRQRVHILRASHDAVMVGIGTVLSDDPMLTPRIPEMDGTKARVVIDTHLKTPPDSQLVTSAHRHPVWLCHARNAPSERIDQLKKAGVKTLECRSNDSGRIELGHALSRLAKLGATRVFCEGGSALAADLLK